MSRLTSSNLLLAAGLAFIGLGAYGYAVRPSGPAVVVPQTDFEIEDVEPGQETAVSIGLENRSSRSVRVVGLGEC